MYQTALNVRGLRGSVHEKLENAPISWLFLLFRGSFGIAKTLLRVLFFLFQQLLLTLQAPAVTAQIAVLTNHAVTGNDQCDRIGPHARATARTALSLPIAFAT